ncbi:putative Hydrolase [Streptomyces viridochromogenes Tue57]|uniref:Putative Hydrolase n=1 Tax=Streptomyces viridochromogenes Tue57 TaxID=1160705 RepID=L8PDH5_STRVR|nr:putative Hydrolase [Streptomyces viridochromogenes Tue57]
MQKRPQRCRSGCLRVRTNRRSCHMTCRTVAHVGYSAGQRTRAA